MEMIQCVKLRSGAIFCRSYSQLLLGFVLFLLQGIPQAAAFFYRSGAVLSDIFNHIPGLTAACVEHRVLFLVGRYEVQCWVTLQTLGANELASFRVKWCQGIISRFGVTYNDHRRTLLQ